MCAGHSERCCPRLRRPTWSRNERLDQIDPGTVGRLDVDMQPRAIGEPLPDQGDWRLRPLAETYLSCQCTEREMICVLDRRLFEPVRTIMEGSCRSSRATRAGCIRPQRHENDGCFRLRARANDSGHCPALFPYISATLPAQARVSEYAGSLCPCARPANGFLPRNKAE